MAEDTAPRAPGASPDPEATLARLLTYRHIRRSVGELVRSRPHAEALPVPACEDWTVRDTVAHLVRNCRTAERALRNAPPRYSATLKRVGLHDLLAEWERSAEQVERLVGLSAPGRVGSVLVMDAVTHEYDLARAFGVPVRREHPALAESLELVLAGLHAALCWRCLPALRVEAPGAQWTAGEGPCVATVAGDRIDLLRSLSGRRTAAQIAALSWSADPAPWLPAFAWGPFVLPDEPVE